jgi:hypothetical protein
MKEAKLVSVLEIHVVSKPNYVLCELHTFLTGGKNHNYWKHILLWNICA